MTIPIDDLKARDLEALAAKLTEAQLEALDYQERTYLEACELNALGLVHLDVVKDADGLLIDLQTRLTPLGEQLRAHITKDKQ